MKGRKETMGPYCRSLTHPAFPTMVEPISGEKQGRVRAGNENTPLEF